MNKTVLFLPVIVFAVIAFFLVGQLANDQSVLPTPMIDKKVPDFELAALPELKHLEHENVIGEVSLINVFGSWCRGCRVEHPVLLKIKESGEVPIYGINWADTPERGAAWLMQFGNSYDRVGNDEGGRTIIGFGVTGAPETFIVDAQGRIRYRHAGPISAETWKKTIRPMVQELQRQAASDS